MRAFIIEAREFRVHAVGSLRTLAFCRLSDNLAHRSSAIGRSSGNPILDASGKCRDSGSGVIYDPANILAAREHTVIKEADNRARGVEVEFNHAIAQSGQIVAAIGNRGMKEYSRFAPVQLIEER